MPEPNFQGIGYDEDDIAGLLGGGGSQVDLSRIGNFLKKGATVGATGLLYGVNPWLAVAAHTPPSLVTLGVKKLGQKIGILDKDKPWGELTTDEKIAVAQEKFGLAEDFYGPTPLARFVGDFIDIITGGVFREKDKVYRSNPLQ